MTTFRLVQANVLFLWCMSQCHAFVLASPPSGKVSWTTKPAASFLMLRESPLDDDKDKNDNPSSYNNDTFVTREMFQRELLADPVVKRKKNGGRRTAEYKVLDNRDSLPFRIENQVPDPYTKKEMKQKKANKVRKQPSSVEEGLKSSLYTDDLNDSDKTMLGEFYLDKHTTSGDLLEIGDIQYKVVRHKCQYKYAGGKRFVMVRKILQVKEIGRLQTEEYLKRQFHKSVDEGGATL